MEPTRLTIDQRASELLLDRSCPPNLQAIIRDHCLLLSDPKLAELVGDISGYSFEQIEALPIEKVVPYLPTILKISALLTVRKSPSPFHGLGFSPIGLDRRIQESEQLFGEVKKITVGVIDSHKIDNYRALRMLCMAEMSRIVDKYGVAVKDAQQHLEEFFVYFDDLLDEAERLPQLQEKIAHILKDFGLLQLHKPSENLVKVIQMLTLFETALKDPFFHISQLLRPLKMGHISFPIRRLCERMHPRVTGWLTEFSKACQLEFASFFEQLKKSLKRENLLGKTKKLWEESQRVFQEMVKNGNEVTHQVDRALTTFHRYEKQKGAAPWLQFEETISTLWDHLAAYRKSHGLLLEKTEAIIVLSSEKSMHYKWRFGTLSFPYFQHMDLIRDILACMQNRCDREWHYQKELEKLLLPKFRQMESVMLLDLIQLQLAQSFMKIPSLQYLQLGFDKILTSIRSYYHFRRRQGEDEATAYLENLAEGPVNAAFQMGSEIEALLTKEVKEREFLQFCREMVKFFNLALSSNHWPQLFEKSPFAKTVSKELERQFFYELFTTIRFRFTQIDPSKMKSHSEVEKVQQWMERCTRLFLDMQGQLKKRSMPPLEGFKREARQNLELISSCLVKIQELSEDLELTLGESFSSTIKEQAGTFLGGMFQHLLPGEPLMAYLFLDELIEEEEKGREPPKIKEVEVPVKEAPKWTPPPPQPLPEPILAVPKQEPFDELKSDCEALIPYCQGFTGPGNSEAHQQEHLTNLLESLKALEELRTLLPSQGHRPAVVGMLWLKLGVALEQSAKLAVALRHLSVPMVDKGNSFFEERGRESLWKEHAPHLFVELLKLDLSKEQNQLLQQMERVVSISSRYPATACDPLTQTLEQLFQMEYFPKEQLPFLSQMRCKQAEKMWHTGVETCLKIVQSAIDSTLQKVSASEEAIDLPPIGEVKKREPAPFQRLEKRLKKIQSLLLLPGHAEVTRLSEGDESVEKRKGTIRTALRDLLVNLRLLKESLEMAVSPLITVESILLRQAVILERVLLIPLAQLPCRSPADPSLHYLWDREGHTLRRNSHALEKFVEKLSEIAEPELIQKTQKLAEQLGPYLRVGYRYQSGNILEPFKKLSQMRLRFLATPEQAAFEEYVEQFVETKIKAPCTPFLEIADEWLKICEKLL